VTVVSPLVGRLACGYVVFSMSHHQEGQTGAPTTSDTPAELQAWKPHQLEISIPLDTACDCQREALDDITLDFNSDEVVTQYDPYSEYSD